MKTTAKLSLLAAAFLLMIAGCANNFTPTEPSKDSFAKNVENKNAQTSKPLTVTTLGFSTPQKYSNGSDYLVTLTFSHPVDLSSIKDAVKFYKLKDGIASTEKPQKGTTIVFDVLDDVNSKNVSQVHFKLKDVDKVMVYAYVTGSAVKAAVTDQKMDQDEDKEQGEPTDDDYGAIFDIGTETDKYGNDSLLLKKKPVTLAGLFKQGTIAYLSFGNENNWLDSDKQKGELGSLVTHIIAKNEKVGDKVRTLKTWGISDKDYGDLLNKYIEVEAFKGNEWTKITPIKFEQKTVNNESWWVAALSGVDAGTPIRANVVNIDKLTVPSEKSKYSYILKYNLDCNASATETLFTSSSGHKVGFSASVLDYKTDSNSVLDAKKAVNANTITLTYTVPKMFKDAVYANKNTYNVELIKNDDGYIVGKYKGLDTTKLKKENFKLSKFCRVMAQYNSNTVLTDNGMSAALSLNSVIRSKSVAMVISNITALGNSITHSTTNKSYYADVTNTVTFAYDDAPSGLELPKDEDKQSICDGIYDALSKLYYSGSTLDRYESSPLTASFVQQLKKDYLLLGKTEMDILNFINKAVGNALKDSKVAFASNGSLSYKEVATSDLYVSPAVKTLEFSGTYKNAENKDVVCTIPSFSFGKVQAESKDQLLREGWAKILVATATK